MRKNILLLFTFAALPLFGGAALIGCGGGDEDDRLPQPASNASGASSAPVGTASIKGKVTLEGAAPAARKIQMAADAKCAAAHSGAVMEDKLLVGEGGALANAVVRVLNAPAAASPPASAAQIDQRGCMYVPHVVAVQVGQELEIRSSDNFMHNVRITSARNQGANLAMPTAGTQKRAFSKAEDLRLACDVHGWMGAVVVVHPNAFIAVTGADGAFELGNLPAGAWEVEVWHETLGSKKMTITVTDGEAKTQDFSLAAG